MTDDSDQAPYVSARRMAPAHHLRKAAQAPLGSEAERYHLLAAIAEALCRIDARGGPLTIADRVRSGELGMGALIADPGRPEQ